MKASIVAAILCASACRYTTASEPPAASAAAKPAERPSAVAALRAVCDFFQGPGGHGASLQRIACRALPETAAKPGQVEVRVDLAFASSGAIQATRDWESARAALDGTEWCLEVHDASPRWDGSGLELSGIQLLVDVRVLHEPQGKPLPGYEQQHPETRIRMAASAPIVAIGQIDIHQEMRSPAPGVTETVYRVQPSMKYQRYTLDRLLNFFCELDTLELGTVTSIDLSPVTDPGPKQPDAWRFDVELTGAAA